MAAMKLNGLKPIFKKPLLTFIVNLKCIYK